MKKLAILFLILAVTACSGRYGAGIPAYYEPLLDDALTRSARPEALKTLLAETPRAEREALAYLIAYMPQGDLDTMNLSLLRENVACACRARQTFSWTKNLPDSIFLNEVLPYAAVDEVRDSWRPDFLARFTPYVVNLDDMVAAIDTINRYIASEVGVEYNTLREKTNQSPSESMRQHMASCTGLSILLVDALRAVGIPARFAGVLSWVDDRGNHSWTEVWFDGEWHFIEYNPAGFDAAWFFADAGKAKVGDPKYGIYAVSYRPTGKHFPMVWNEHSTSVPAVEVTQRYVDAYRAHIDRLASRSDDSCVRVAIRMFRDSAHSEHSADRVAVNVDVFCGDRQVGGGRTASPEKDMNDDLTLLLNSGQTYTLRYENARGEAVEIPFEATGTGTYIVTAYYQ